MQGMKIKNVVPGKIASVFLSCFGAVERLHVPPSKFRFLRHSIFANVLLRGFCCLFVQALSIEAECVAVVTRQQRIWRIHYQQLENAIQCQSRGTSDRMCPLSAVYIIYITGGGYVDMWTYLKWRQLCWCFACWSKTCFQKFSKRDGCMVMEDVQSSFMVLKFIHLCTHILICIAIETTRWPGSFSFKNQIYFLFSVSTMHGALTVLEYLVFFSLHLYIYLNLGFIKASFWPKINLKYAISRKGMCVSANTFARTDFDVFTICLTCSSGWLSWLALTNKNPSVF